ncbi:MAG: hypothetical protein JW862_05825 [Anaerolineales bacterium]|nr:hypothetical protein [Anaerolineales bacterium]
MKRPPLIGLVGICGSGKTTLAEPLMQAGYPVRQIAQEHSHTPDMWQRLTNPDLLIYLHVSYPISMQRKHFHWLESEYQEQARRLAHARQHADLVIDTDPLNPAEVLQQVLDFLDKVAEKVTNTTRRKRPGSGRDRRGWR